MTFFNRFRAPCPKPPPDGFEQSVQSDLRLIIKLLTQVNLTDAFASLAASDTELKKDLTEIRTTVDTLNTQVANLTAQLASVTLTPDQQATVDSIAATAKTLDDITPDAPASA